ncbi:MAG: hypothetical protein AAF581_16960 [Planctomycetota bacterium]
MLGLLRSWPFAAAAVALCLLPGLSHADDDPAAAGPTVVREIYVPFAQFRKLQQQHPNGIVMKLAEYHDLVARALANQPRATVELPPIAAAVTTAEYRGELFGRTVRFTGTLEVAVRSESWVQCSLGSIPPLGAVTVDGAPGWVVVQGGETFLLLRGRGSHAVELQFQAPVTDDGDHTALQLSLAPSTAARVTVVVPGSVRGESPTGALESQADGTTTTFRLACDPRRAMTLRWQRLQAQDANPVLIAAEHELSVLPSQPNAQFAWITQATVSRRKIDRLTFVEPPSLDVVRIDGDLVLRWERTAAGLEVQFKEPVSGAVLVRFSGVVTTQAGPITITPPGVRGAFTNHGFLSVLAPANTNVAVTETTNLRATDPMVAGTLPVNGVTTPLYRFGFRESNAQLVLGVSSAPLRTEARGSFLARIREERMLLDGFLHLEIREGRGYLFTLKIPNEWRLLALREVWFSGKQGEARRIRTNQRTVGDDTEVTIRLERAATTRYPLRLRLRAESTAFVGGRDWEQRNVALALPHLLGAERTRTDLGVSLHESIALETSALPDWRTLADDEAARLGLAGHEEQEIAQDSRLVLAATTRTTPPLATVELLHIRPRLEYRSVSHVLAAESVLGQEAGRHAMRVRSDIELAVVGRAIEQLTLTHPPLPAGTVVVIQGPEIKETENLAAAGVQRVRFDRPWLGVRHFRVEYEAAHLPGIETELPEIGIPGDVQGERFLVLQSQGSVEVTTKPAATLVAIDVDELPDFAEQWSDGRVLRAYRQRRSGAPGTLSTTIHDRAPVLQQLIRSLRLQTQLAADGTARTQADLLLTYSRQQVLPVELPAGSRCLGVTINDQPVHSVRAEGDGRFAIPLPSRSHAAVTIFYERSATTGSALSGAGHWHGVGPRFAEIPVGETHWTIYHPAGYQCQVEGGNVRPIVAADGPMDRSFASAVIGRLLSAQWPNFTTFRERSHNRGFAQTGALTDAEKSGAETKSGASDQRLRGQGRLQTKGVATTTAALPRPQLLPEGHAIETSKIGGAPRLVMSYRTQRWERLSKRFVFFGTLCLALFLLRRHGRTALRHLLLWGLTFGTLVPVAFRYSSPLLLVPFCEALFAVVVGWFLLTLLKAVSARLVRVPVPRLRPGWMLLVLCLPAMAQASDDVDPFQPVVVPYHADGSPWNAGNDTAVFLPEAQFRALRQLAEKATTAPDRGASAGIDFVVGTAHYEADVRSRDAVVKAELALYVFSQEWVQLSLPFDRLQVERVTVDGIPVGVGQGAQGPFLALRGRGAHRVALTLRGTVVEQLGQFGFSSQLLHGGATSVRALLPVAAEVSDRRQVQSVQYVQRSSNATIVELPLPQQTPLALQWSFPQVSGSVGTQLESLSYTELTLTRHDLSVVRQELLQFTGAPQTKVSFEVSGNWEIRSVDGDAISEWQLLAPADAKPRLEVFFVRPQSSARLRITGSAPYDNGASSLCTLTLAGAARQETYVGLRHGAGRQFSSGANVLAGFRQVSTSAAAAAQFAVSAIDRLYHAYASGTEATVQVESPARTVRLRTQGVALLQSGRVEYFLRSTYDTANGAVLRHVVPLPAGWTVRSVQSRWLRSWRVAGSGPARQLIIEFHGAVPDGSSLVWSASGPLPAANDPVVLPAVRTQQAEAGVPVTVDETLSWSVAGHEQLEILTTDASEWQSVTGSDAEISWVQLPELHSYRFAYRSRRAQAPITVTARPRPSSLGATVASFVRIAQQRIAVSATVFLRVGPGARDAFTLQLPPGAELVSLETANLASRKTRTAATGEALVEVSLQSRISGEHPVDLVYRLPRPTTSTLSLTPLHVLENGVPLRDASHYIGIVQADRTVTLTTKVVGLSPVEADRFPTLPQGVSSQSLTPTYLAVSPEWSLEVSEQWIEEADRLDALIQLADLSTVIGYDGTIRTQVLYTLRNDRLQFLTVELPQATELWGVTVNGRPVAVGGGAARTLRIPVPRGSNIPVEVAVSYAEGSITLGGSGDRKRLRAPYLPTAQAVQVQQSIWSVQFPDGYTVTETGEKMRPAPASLRSAERLKNLLHQQERAYKAAQSSGSRKARDRAEQQLARIGQELGDNLAQLKDQNRSSLDKAQEIDLGDLNMQWAANDMIINDTEVAQQRLREELQKQGAQQDARASRDEQLFQDRANFLRGRNERRGGRSRPTAAVPGNHSYRLLDGLAYPGWMALEGPPPTRSAAVRSDRGVPVGGAGLRPLPASPRPGLAPALDPFAERPGHETYTFRGDDANAELTLRFTPPGRGSRALAWLLLLAAGGVLFLAWQGRRA